MPGVSGGLQCRSLVTPPVLTRWPVRFEASRARSSAARGQSATMHHLAWTKRRAGVTFFLFRPTGTGECQTAFGGTTSPARGAMRTARASPLFSERTGGKAPGCWASRERRLWKPRGAGRPVGRPRRRTHIARLFAVEARILHRPANHGEQTSALRGQEQLESRPISRVSSWIRRCRRASVPPKTPTRQKAPAISTRKWASTPTLLRTMGSIEPRIFNTAESVQLMTA